MIGKESTFYKVICSNKNEIDEIIDKIPKYYYRNEIPKRDQFGNVRLKDGCPEVRVLYPSKGRLKEIQRAINRRILSNIDLPSAIHGAVKNKSCITNAKAHQGNKFFFLTDLKNYFPSIHFRIVYQELVKVGFSPKVASIITRLVTYNKSVPQGAPTSSSISNLVFLPIDRKLINLCKENKIVYTRYIDDLAFSSKSFISDVIIQEILNHIRESSFQYHHRKTFMNIGITEVTGCLVMGNNLDAPIRKYEKLNKLDPQSNSAKGLASHIKSIKNA